MDIDALIADTSLRAREALSALLSWKVQMTIHPWDLHFDAGMGGWTLDGMDPLEWVEYMAQD